MENPILVRKHDKVVWCTPAMDTLREEHCMCLHCGKMKPGLPGHCEIATKFYNICLEHGNAFMMVRCHIWEDI